jgi:hypothetical protein
MLTKPRQIRTRVQNETVQEICLLKLPTMFHDAKDRLRDISDRSVEYSRENPWIVAGVGISVLVGGLLVSGSKKEHRAKPGTGSLSGGGIKRDEVKKAYSDYHSSYGQGAGEGITDRTKTTGPILLSDLRALDVIANFMFCSVLCTVLSDQISLIPPIHSINGCNLPI